MLSEAVYVYTRNADLRPRQSSWFDGLVRFYLIMLKIIDHFKQNQLLVDNRWSSKALKNMDILLSLRFGIFEKSPLGDFLERFEKNLQTKARAPIWSSVLLEHLVGKFFQGVYCHKCFSRGDFVVAKFFWRYSVVANFFFGGILW